MVSVSASLLAAAVLASITVTARPDVKIVEVGDEITVEVDVRGPGLSTATVTAAEMPDGLEIGHAQGPRLERRIELLPGNRQVQVERLIWIFSVTPTKPGTFRVPPFTIKAGTWTEKTEPFEVKASGSFDARRIVFVETRVDPRPRWVGEPISVELVAGVANDWLEPTNRLIENEAVLNVPWITDGIGPGSTVDDDPIATKVGVPLRLSNGGKIPMIPGQETRGREKFATWSTTTRFVPSREGLLTVGPTSFRAIIAVEVEADPIFRDRIYAKRTKLASVTAPNVKIQVKPLPQPRPDDFSGLVGRLALDVEASPKRVAVGESLRVRVKVFGEGNLGTAPLPRFEIRGFKRFGVVEEVDPESGSRTLVYDLAPLATDVTHLPPFRFEIFDTGSGRYRTLSSKPIPIDVLPGGAVSLAADTPTPTSTVAAPPSAARAPIAWGPVVTTGAIFTAAPLAAYAAYALFTRRRPASTPAKRKRRDAARETLDESLASLPRESRAAAAIVATAVTRFLADLADLPPETFRGVDLESALEPHLDAPLRKRVAQLVSDAERAAFGDGRSDVASLARAAAGLANALQSTWR